MARYDELVWDPILAPVESDYGIDLSNMMNWRRLPNASLGNMDAFIHPVTGETFNSYNARINNQNAQYRAQEAARQKAIQDWVASPEGIAQTVRNQYDIFNGRTPSRLQYETWRPEQHQSYYITSPFSSGFTAPTINDPTQGAAYQRAWTDYYRQFLPYGVDSTMAFDRLGSQFQNIGAYQYMMEPGGEMSVTPVPNQPGYKFDTTFSQAQLDAVKNDPELYNFAQQWNQQVAAAENWGMDLQNPYSVFYNATPQGYEAPVRGQTQRYGVPFGGVPGAQGIGATNDNPIPDTPGAGLWVYGIDPNNPSQIAQAYKSIFFRGGDEGAAQALSAFAPRQNPDGSWSKATSIEDLYNFAGSLDSYYRQLSQKIDLPKSGIFDSIAGKIILGGLTSALTGGIGSIVGGLTGNAAIGNIASALSSAGIGGATGGLQGAITGGLGSAIGSGVDFAGGVGEFIRNPLDALGGAFDVGAGAVGGGVGGLLLDDMGSAAQVGPGSLASNTPPVTGQIIPTESVVVTGTVPAVTNTGSAIGAGIGNIAGNLIGGSVTSAPGNVSFTGSYVDPATGNVVEEYTVTGNASDTTEIGGGGTASTAIGAGAGAATGLLNPTTGGATGITGGTTGAAGGTTGTPATTGGTTAGTGLLDQTITGGTTGGTATGSGAATQEPTPVQVGSQEWLNQLLATQATTSPMLPVNPVNSWANSGMGQVQDFVSAQTPSTPETGSQEWLNAILAGAGLGAAGVGLAGLGGSSPVNGWAFSGTGTPQDFVTPGGGISDGAGLGGGSGLGDGTGLGGGLGDGTGLGGGLGDGTGLGTGTGEGTGLGAGIGAGLGLLADAAPIVDQAVQATNNPLDFGLPDLSMLTGGTAGGLGEATGSGIYGGKMGGFEGKYPKTPKKKKRGITVQIAGARRNA